ncbi:hypothetical protein H490_0110150 [Leucobacter sp. UCD-THU]|uniref:DUF418 domain-containing protein n=1 Tax=Leucobacter sp. UCD-THU TaxID=1292023 RepID=UPI0003666C3D|nr:DUF418 domain-containing protein [Leucobacter sp. UCD-THU]EYT53704.1 hypothetical protein H490_0110150 [Leucobacter sp. UCD-THU]
MPHTDSASTNTSTNASTNAAPPAPARRALAPDLARGWMLLLIAIANVSAYLWGHDTPLYTTHPPDGSALDRALSALTILFVDARVYPMFAFLFGYGMVQFARSRETRGVPLAAVRGMFWRRHWWLLAFGFVHAALLFAGDILGAYGLAGLALTAALFWRSDRVLKFATWTMFALIAFGAVSLLGLGLLLNALVPADSPALMTGADFGSTADMLNGVQGYGWAMLARIGMWLVSTPATVLSLVVPLCILLGWLAGRHRWLEAAGARIGLGAVAGWGILVSTVAAAPTALLYLGLLPALEPVAWATMLLNQLAGAAGGVGYAALFGVIGLRLQYRAGAVSRAVAAVGKRSLSIYLLQSVVFAPLLAAWGFGLGSRVNTAAAFGIALGAWLLSLILAVILERRGARGPAEVLLRRLTYARLDEPAAPLPAAPPAPSAARTAGDTPSTR